MPARWYRALPLQKRRWRCHILVECPLRLLNLDWLEVLPVFVEIRESQPVSKVDLLLLLSLLLLYLLLIELLTGLTHTFELNILEVELAMLLCALVTSCAGEGLLLQVFIDLL